MRQIAGFAAWIGNASDGRDLKSILDKGISAVVDLASNERSVPLPRELYYLRCPLMDGAGNPSWLLQTAVSSVRLLIENAVPTLVFCAAGMSRSPSVVAAALSLIKGCPAMESLEFVTRNAPKDVSPGFWKDVQSILAR